MKKVTIDTNCIIDLEEDRESAECVRSLIKINDEGKIKLRVVAISASERMPNGTYASTFGEFKDKLERVGLSDVEILKPIHYWGIVFWGQSVWADDEMVRFEKRIHKILFREIEFKYEDYCTTLRLVSNQDSQAYHRWRNAKCDVQCLWAHIFNKGDIFVTNDRNFHKHTKKDALITLGAGEILTPKETVLYIKKNIRT